MADDGGMLATMEQLEYGREAEGARGRQVSPVRERQGGVDPYRKSVEDLKRHLQEFDAKQCEKYAKVNVKNAAKEQDMLRVRRMNEQRRNQSRMLFWSCMLGSSSMTNTAGTLIGMALGMAVTGGFGPRVGRDGKTRAERRAERISNAVSKLENKQRDASGVSRGLGILLSPSARLSFGYMARNMALSSARRHVPVSVDELGVAYLGNMQATMDAIADIQVKYGGGKNPGKYAREMADLRIDANRRLGTLFEMGAANKVGEREIYNSAKRISQQFDNTGMGMSFGKLDGFSSDSMLRAYQVFLDGGDMNRIASVLDPLAGRRAASPRGGEPRRPEPGAGSVDIDVEEDVEVPAIRDGDGSRRPYREEDVEDADFEYVDDEGEAASGEGEAGDVADGVEGEQNGEEASADEPAQPKFEGSAYATPVGDILKGVEEKVSEEFDYGTPQSASVCQAVMMEACHAASEMLHGGSEHEVLERSRAEMEPYGKAAVAAIEDAALGLCDVVETSCNAVGITASTQVDGDAHPLRDDVISMCRLQTYDVLVGYASECMDRCCGGEAAGPVREPYGHFVGTLDNALSKDGFMFDGLGEPGSLDMSERVRDFTIALSEVVEPSDGPVTYTLDNKSLDDDFHRSLGAMCDALRYDMMGIFSTKSDVNEDSFDVEARFEDESREPTDEDYAAYEAWEDADAHAMHRTFVAAAVSVAMSRIRDSGEFDGGRLGILSASRHLGGDRLSYFRSNDFGFDGLKSAVEGIRDGADVASFVGVLKSASERNGEVSNIDCDFFEGCNKPILAYTDEECRQWQIDGEVPLMDAIADESLDDFEREEGDLYVPSTEEANRVFSESFSVSDDGRDISPIPGSATPDVGDQDLGRTIAD